MPDERQCPKCGAALPADAPKGLCPHCLMAAGLEGGDPAAPPPKIPSKAIIEEEIGGRIDRYKILQKLGEGGCGVVYMAEQTEPVRRRVALKVIKLGMDTRQVIARFEAERQALALMDHPNIARVLDAGATLNGRPYFVMELVKGVRITDYCDQNHLSARERLNLFVQVCQAIQHAHQKGIIHRDIKPSNILVTLHDGVPIPKVIDFGIAKATDQPLTEKTVFTEVGRFMGTPAYMSPEQAELSGLDIDTRSDIYALGVLLYELLTGRTPFDAKELSQAGLDEMRRRIREEEPIRPSTRLNTMANADLTKVAERRQSEPAKLTRFLRGDLDWIVMKCLEKDRMRRYDTANGLAMDIQRYLNNEPVIACPPSSLYRFEKMVRRNKLAVGALGGVTLSLLLGLGLSTWLWLKERESSATVLKVIQAFDQHQNQVWRTRVPPARKSATTRSTNAASAVVPPGDARLNGTSYAQWAAAWWKWSQEMPLTNSAGVLIHPFRVDAEVDVAAFQKNDVWFLAAPFGTVERRCRIPYGKSLFFPLFCAEFSNIEEDWYAATAIDQAEGARYVTDQAFNLFCEIDGDPVANLSNYRTASPQISLSVPSPWIQGETGGIGTSSGDGYFIFLAPLPPGEHTLHFGGAIRVRIGRNPIPLEGNIDVTYHLTVTESLKKTTAFV
ncbi:MAG TPA: serine/threonine-protein kinase, partial [Verrucomicrobiae bacterium]|nr:serine/threonine-protein kinase [Verrucomicrobiae bacterium]